MTATARAPVVETPWGVAHQVRAVGPDGIFSADTATHGGYFVPSALLDKIDPRGRADAKKWSGSENWYEDEPQTCPGCNHEEVTPTVNVDVPRDVAETFLGRALASCRAVVNAWEGGDLAGAAQSCAESVAEFEEAVNEAPVVPLPEPTAAGLLAEINDTWGEQFADDDMIEGADFVEWVAEWMKRVRAALTGKAVQA